MAFLPRNHSHSSPADMARFTTTSSSSSSSSPRQQLELTASSSSVSPLLDSGYVEDLPLLPRTRKLSLKRKNDELGMENSVYSSSANDSEWVMVDMTSWPMGKKACQKHMHHAGSTTSNASLVTSSVQSQSGVRTGPYHHPPPSRHGMETQSTLYEVASTATADADTPPPSILSAAAGAGVEQMMDCGPDSTRMDSLESAMDCGEEVSSNLVIPRITTTNSFDGGGGSGLNKSGGSSGGCSPASSSCCGDQQATFSFSPGRSHSSAGVYSGMASGRRRFGGGGGGGGRLAYSDVSPPSSHQDQNLSFYSYRNAVSPPSITHTTHVGQEQSLSSFYSYHEPSTFGSSLTSSYPSDLSLLAHLSKSL